MPKKIPEFQKKYIKEIEKLYEQGYTLKDIIKMWGIKYHVIYKWREMYEEFDKACIRAISHGKRGRPFSMDEKIDLGQLERLAMIGMDKERIAIALGISKETFYRYLEYDEFSNALKKGKANGIARAERSLFMKMNGYTHDEEKVFCSNGKIVTHVTEKHYPPDLGSLVFFLTNQDKENWQNRQNVSGNVNVTHRLSLKKLKESKDKIDKDDE